MTRLAYKEPLKLEWFGKVEVDIEVLPDSLAFWWAYQRALWNSDEGMKLERGSLMIHLDDDVNMPGWYYFAKPDRPMRECRDFIKQRLGRLVRVPWEALHPDPKWPAPKYTVHRR